MMVHIIFSPCYFSIIIIINMHTKELLYHAKEKHTNIYHNRYTFIIESRLFSLFIHSYLILIIRDMYISKSFHFSNSSCRIHFISIEQFSHLVLTFQRVTTHINYFHDNVYIELNVTQ